MNSPYIMHLTDERQNPVGHFRSIGAVALPLNPV